MADTQNWRNDLKEFDDSPEGYGYDLRLDLAEMIVRHLHKSGRTQPQLADSAKLKPSFVTSLIHSSQNCTLETAGKVFHAMGIRAKLVAITDNEQVIFSQSQWMTGSTAQAIQVCMTMQSIGSK